jgi:solute carrier family 25 citrate transporter 1
VSKARLFRDYSDFMMTLYIGGVTGAIEISITYPTEFMKTVMQLDKSKQKLGALGVAKEAIAKHGPLGLYKGYSALLMFSIPKNYVRFGMFTYAEQNWLKTKSKTNTFLCGLIAGGAEALLVVTPQETLKTKLVHDKISEQPKYRGLFHGIYMIAKERGIGGIYRGPTATVLKQSSN